MNQQDVILDDFSEANSLAQYPIIAIYKHPADYPDSYVARIWNLDKPTPYVVLRDSIEQIRQTVPATMKVLMPYKEDDPIICETWI